MYLNFPCIKGTESLTFCEEKDEVCEGSGSGVVRVVSRQVISGGRVGS